MQFVVSLIEKKRDVWRPVCAMCDAIVWLNGLWLCRCSSSWLKTPRAAPVDLFVRLALEALRVDIFWRLVKIFEL